MKKIYLLAFLFLANQLKAQKGYKIVYEKKETMQTANGQMQTLHSSSPGITCVLVFNDSLAYSYQILEGKTKDNYKKTATIFGNRAKHHHSFYEYTSNQKIDYVAHPNWRKPLLVFDTAVSRHFVIQEDNIKIGDMNCQRGYMMDLGDTVFAVISKDIKQPLGPWCYVGLPGLVIEIYYKKFDIYYSMKTIQEGNFIVQMPELPKISWTTFRKKYK